MYWLLILSIILAFLFLINLAGAIAVSALWRLMSRAVQALPPPRRAQAIFALRCAPLVTGLILVIAFIAPAYLLYEPANSGEIISTELAVVAGLALAVILFALFRALKSQIATSNLASAWRDGASDVFIEGLGVAVSKIEHPFPVVAVVGIARPRIFIAEQVLTALTRAELEAVMAHECGHIKSHDNLKRSILRFSRDLLFIPVGADLDQAWSETAEAAADEYAAHSGRSGTLELASALVKLARIAPPRLMVPEAAVGSFLFGTGTADIAARVRQLLYLTDKADKVVVGYPKRGFAVLLWGVFLWGLFFFQLTDQRLLLTTHDAIEYFVRLSQ